MARATPLPTTAVWPFSETDDYQFKFVGEGAANFVFEIIVSPADGARCSFLKGEIPHAPGSVRDPLTSSLGKLLRVPKAGTEAHSYEELQEYWETVVAPLFELEDLVQQQLVKFENDNVISRLNGALQDETETRRTDFEGQTVAATEYGLLVEDMRQKNPDDLTLEFKPKWLAQSPNAPPSATRCRNCAREAFKRHSKHPSKRKPNAVIPCPLDYLSPSPSSLTHPLTPHTPPTTHPSQHARLSTWLQTNTLLPRLRAVQLANDTLGPLGVDHGGAGAAQLQLAMTLRDCACFVRVPADEGAEVEAKLADLDKKNWVSKLGYWQGMERRLVEGGYYEGGEVPRVGTGCVLERGEGAGVREGEDAKDVGED
ncbi:inositol pentakisphosphate 2-kinase [Staphylotrichum tortipilum]|uniref:Inositol-pentakisphosphate 2-kinase n=1 Tax=Staphylotrichum tortipilum TaxID=2831512 RepID=A0AAN6MKM0_9PEZI|nr:inositol pentakisphosphate 2-kinase [Staphylotrichum longicolle]